MGVWIETQHLFGEAIDIKSHPAWVCGLKQTKWLLSLVLRRHTLRGCVDWNSLFTERRRELQSHPAWVCGLKLWEGLHFCGRRRSHPAWVCGLKRLCWKSYLTALTCHTLRGCVDWNLFEDEEVTPSDVTPCVGVWIETYNARIVKILHESHPAWVCGLKHPNNDSYVSIRGHTLRGCVDWNNPFRKLLIQISLSHPAWVCGLKLVYHQNKE